MPDMSLVSLTGLLSPWQIGNNQTDLCQTTRCRSPLRETLNLATCTDNSTHAQMIVCHASHVTCHLSSAATATDRPTSNSPTMHSGLVPKNANHRTFKNCSRSYSKLLSYLSLVFLTHSLLTLSTQLSDLFFPLLQN